MNTFKGPFKVVSKEMALTFYINAFLTVALFGLYIFLSSNIDPNELLGVIFGPLYVVFFAYPFIFFKAYKYILSLGGTRKQFMISAISASMIYLIAATVLLNVLHLLGGVIFQNGYNFHMADLLADPSTAMYFWIDFLWMFILFGIGMFAQAILFNFGAIRTLILGAIIILASVTAYFFMDLTPLFEFIIQEHLLFIHLFALLSLILIAASYFMMRNAPLERGGRKIFKVSSVN